MLLQYHPKPSGVHRCACSFDARDGWRDVVHKEVPRAAVGLVVAVERNKHPARVIHVRFELFESVAAGRVDHQLFVIVDIVVQKHPVDFPPHHRVVGCYNSGVTTVLVPRGVHL